MERKNTIVVNLFAAPGVGKTTTMSAVFAELKKSGIDAELSTEFVKELLWEGCAVDELYVLAEQNHRLFRLNGKVDVIVTDRPLPLTLLYNSDDKALCNIAMQTFDKYRNLNFLLKRNPRHIYSSNGRYQSEEESKALDGTLKKILNDNRIPYEEVLSASSLTVKTVVDKVKRSLYKPI